VTPGVTSPAADAPQPTLSALNQRSADLSLHIALRLLQVRRRRRRGEERQDTTSEHEGSN